MDNGGKALTKVETSPNGRYIRFDKSLGSGSYKDVWLGFDSETGTQVAWNTVNLHKIKNPMESKRISSETEILKCLNHNHIMRFYETWNNEEKEEV